MCIATWLNPRSTIPNFGQITQPIRLTKTITKKKKNWKKKKEKSRYLVRRDTCWPQSIEPVWTTYYASSKKKKKANVKSIAYKSWPIINRELCVCLLVARALRGYTPNGCRVTTTLTWMEHRDAAIVLPARSSQHEPSAVFPVLCALCSLRRVAVAQSTLFSVINSHRDRQIDRQPLVLVDGIIAIRFLALIESTAFRFYYINTRYGLRQVYFLVCLV